MLFDSNFIVYYIICQGDKKDILPCDTYDQNTKYVFVSNGTQVVFFDPNLQY